MFNGKLLISVTGTDCASDSLTTNLLEKSIRKVKTNVWELPNAQAIEQVGQDASKKVISIEIEIRFKPRNVRPYVRPFAHMRI